MQPNAKKSIVPFELFCAASPKLRAYIQFLFISVPDLHELLERNKSLFQRSLPADECTRHFAIATFANARNARPRNLIEIVVAVSHFIVCLCIIDTAIYRILRILGYSVPIRIEHDRHCGLEQCSSDSFLILKCA